MTTREPELFSVEERDALRERILELANQDERVVAAAEVGSLAAGPGDRWSDVDLTFAVKEGVGIADVLDEWTETLVSEGGVQLFDLTAGPIVYRVFMFPGCLQIDLSFSPASDFRPTSPRFRLLFGSAGDMQEPAPAAPAELVGWALLWAKHARVCIERGLLWQAEYCIASLRQQATSFACLRRDLPWSYGRGVDQLPPDVHERFATTLLREVERNALAEALKACVRALSAECTEDAGIDQRLCERLAETVVGI